VADFAQILRDDTHEGHRTTTGIKTKTGSKISPSGGVLKIALWSISPPPITIFLPNLVCTYNVVLQSVE